MRIIVLAALALVALGGCMQRPWVKHTYPEWGFTAWFPSEPVARDTTTTQDGRTVRGFAVEGGEKDKDLAIGVIDLTGVDKPDDQVMAESVRAIAAGKPFNMAYWALGPAGAQHMGRAAVVDQGGGMKLQLRVLVANGKLYQVSARSLGTTSPKAKEFLESFQIIEPPKP